MFSACLGCIIGKNQQPGSNAQCLIKVWEKSQDLCMTWHQVCVYSMIKDRGYISHHSKSNCVWNSQSAVVSSDWFHPQAAQRIDTMSWELQRQRWFLISKLSQNCPLPKIVLLSIYHSSYCALMYERSYTSLISVLLYVEGRNADCKAAIHRFPFLLHTFLNRFLQIQSCTPKWQIFLFSTNYGFDTLHV